MTVQKQTALRNTQLDAWQLGACTGPLQSGNTYDNWAASTSYTAFTDWRVAGGNLYMCRTSGTSASSGGGPSGTTDDITDGTCHWCFIGSAGIGPSPKVRIYSGALPASCAASESGTLLVEFDLAAVWAPAAASGIKAISSTPITATAVGGGTGTNATHYRIYDASGTTCLEQGAVTVTGGSGDATIDNISIATTQTVSLTGLTLTAAGA